MTAPDCVGAEGAKNGFIQSGVRGPVKGSSGMGKGERRRRRLMKGLRPELGPGPAIDHA